MDSPLLNLLHLALFAMIAISVSITNIEAHEPRLNYRISTFIYPSHYSIALKPYLLDSDGDKRFTFDGQVFIDIDTSEVGVNRIIMHSNKLTYKVRELYETKKPDIKLVIAEFIEDSATEKFTLKLAEPLKPKTNYTLHFVYTGLMEDDMQGFYKSSYVDNKNTTRWLGATHFQTNNARRAFPCFDEPKFKATFDLSITRFKSFKTVSNTPMAFSMRLNKDYYKDTFVTTPRMSTYLLAFLVSNFNELNDIEGEFYVIARPEYYSQTQYALDVGRKLLAEYNKYTRLPFYETGIEKMHLAAIPDFEAGAMENWGLITYRERAVLYDEGSSRLWAKQVIAAIIAHEQAHMWFGDLVTCEWWSYTWLNEGFATYFQHFMTAEVLKEFEIDKQFVIDQLQEAFKLDATNNTNPMTDTTVNSPFEVSQIFNRISYNKGGSVIRMIKHAMGEVNFQRSLQGYLNRYKYNNTVPQNIFDYWKNKWPVSSMKYANRVFSSFTEQVGYPVIHIEVAEDSQSMTINQKRFLFTPEDGSDASLLYTVPFTYTTDLDKNFNSTFPNLYLEANTQKVTVHFKEAVNWVVGNIQETGYYRVNYSAPAWLQIHKALRSENWDGIHELNRAQIVDDLLSLSRAGELNYEFALKCLSYLETETNYLPWEAAFNGLDFLSHRLGSDKDNFAYFIIKMSKKAYKKLGFVENKTDKPLDIFARSKIIKWNCKYDHKDCISESLKLFRNRHNIPIPVNIRGEVYCAALRAGTEADFEGLYQDMKAETVSSKHVLIMNNLGCVRNEKLVKRCFNIILSDDVRRQDKSYALNTLYSENAENISPVFDLVVDNFQAFKNAFGSNSSVAIGISNIASRFTTQEQLHKLDAFIVSSGRLLGPSEKILTKAAKTVKENLAWSEKRLTPVVEFLRNFRNSARSIGISSLTVALGAFMSYMLR